MVLIVVEVEVVEPVKESVGEVVVSVGEMEVVVVAEVMGVAVELKLVVAWSKGAVAVVVKVPDVG